MTPIKAGLMLDSGVENLIAPGASRRVSAPTHSRSCRIRRLICLSPGFEIVGWRHGWLKQRRAELPLRSDDFLPGSANVRVFDLEEDVSSFARVTFDVRNLRDVPARFQGAVLYVSADQILADASGSAGLQEAAVSAKEAKLDRMDKAFEIDDNWRVEGDRLLLKKDVLRDGRDLKTPHVALIVVSAACVVDDFRIVSPGWTLTALYVGSETVYHVAHQNEDLGLRSELFSHPVPVIWPPLQDGAVLCLNMVPDSLDVPPFEAAFRFHLI